MIRYLTERVPVMVCPNWVYTLMQPIAIRDVLAYLTEAVRSSGHDRRDPPRLHHRGERLQRPGMIYAVSRRGNPRSRQT
jgi:hypothetical protein